MTYPWLNFNGCNWWSLGMDKWLHLILYDGCNYLFMLGLNLSHVSSKRGHWSYKEPQYHQTRRWPSFSCISEDLHDNGSNLPKVSLHLLACCVEKSTGVRVNGKFFSIHLVFLFVWVWKRWLLIYNHIFDRWHRSWAAGTPVKYECDWKEPNEKLNLPPVERLSESFSNPKVYRPLDLIFTDTAIGILRLLVPWHFVSPRPLISTWINFNPSMDKWLNAQ